MRRRFKVRPEDIPDDIAAREWVMGQGEGCLGATPRDGGIDFIHRRRTVTNDELVRWITAGVKKGFSRGKILRIIMKKANLTNRRSLEHRIKRLEKRGVVIPKTPGQLRAMTAGRSNRSTAFRESHTPTKLEGTAQEKGTSSLPIERGREAKANGARRLTPTDARRQRK